MEKYYAHYGPQHCFVTECDTEEEAWEIVWLSGEGHVEEVED